MGVCHGEIPWLHHIWPRSEAGNGVVRTTELQLCRKRPAWILLVRTTSLKWCNHGISPWQQPIRAAHSGFHVLLPVERCARIWGDRIRGVRVYWYCTYFWSTTVETGKSFMTLCTRAPLSGKLSNSTDCWCSTGSSSVSWLLVNKLQQSGVHWLNQSEVQSTLRITTLGGASEKCPYTRSLIICITVRWDFALGMEILSLFANCRYIRSRY